MTEETRPPGKTTVAPDVLLSIARLTALRIEGVHALSNVHQAFRRLVQSGHSAKGVRADILGDRVTMDLHVVLDHDVNVRQVSREIQKEVARAISEMVGMQAERVNVHIEDIHYPESTSSPSE